jgi:hypothetical protein
MAEQATTSRPPEENPRAASEDSSRASSPEASSFVGDAGPAFAADGQNAREGFAAPEIAPDPALAFGWEEDSVRSILTAKGGVLHMLAGVGDQDWLYTEADLMAIAPPLTRILNRYPVTQAAAGTGDELAVLIGVGGYATRSYIERKAILESAAEEAEVPVSGRAAEPDTGPPQQEEKPQWTTTQQ